MEFIDESDFSDQQKQIIHMRVEGKSLAFIISFFNGSSSCELSKDSLITCLLRSALARNWYKGMHGGNDKYLSKPDFENLRRKL